MALVDFGGAAAVDRRGFRAGSGLGGSLAVGAIAGGISTMFTDWWEYQFIAASAGAVLSLVFLRPLAMRAWFSGDSVATGVDALPGRRVRVTADFDARTGRGPRPCGRRRLAH